MDTTSDRTPSLDGGIRHQHADTPGVDANDRVTDTDNIQIRFQRTPPGSLQALNRGCTCLPVENRFGCGRWETGADHPVFTVDTECRLHGVNAMLDQLGID
jgi:hypothetical protein